MRTLKIFLVFLALQPLVCPAANDVAVKDLSGLQLSGYAKNNLLQWTIEAKSADLADESKNIKNPTKNGIWDVRELRLAFFADGEKSVEMKSESARFFPREKTASSESSVFVSGDFFSVNGKGWRWANGNNENSIEIMQGVVVTILRPKTEEDGVPAGKNAEVEKAVVTAQKMKIVTDDAGTTMSFSGEVTVLYGEMLMNADRLEIQLPFGKSVSSDLGTSRAPFKGLSAVSSICGKGNAVLHAREHRAFGDAVEFVPAEEKVYVRGNARFEFESKNGDVVVRGAEGSGDIKTKHFELDGISGADGVPAVKIEMPSLAMRRNKNWQANPLARAHLTGQKLLIDLLEDENVLTLDGNVRLYDEEWNVRANWLCARLDRDFDIEGEVSDGNVGDNNLLAVKSLTLRGFVEVSNGTQSLHCDEAQLFPRQQKAELRGRLKIQEGEAYLTGDRANVFYDEERLQVLGDEAKGVPVKAWLPAMKEQRRHQLEALTEVQRMSATGKNLELTHNGDLVVVDILDGIEISDPEFKASADRVVVFVKDSKDDIPRQVRKDYLDPSIQRVAVFGNINLENTSGRMTGGIATIDNNLEVTEWLDSDKGGQGERPVRIAVEADPAMPQTTRPRFFMTGEKTAAGTGAYIEGDHLEVLLEASRVRFWLRNDVRLMTEDAQGRCHTVEGLCLPKGTEKRLELERVVARGNVLLDYGSSLAKGNLLELFPQEDLAVLSGSAQLIDDRGISVTPGDDRFIYNTKTREIKTFAAAEKLVGLGQKTTQVSRPKIKISGGSDLNFVVPAKK
ncbi:MAG: hypothetical protein K6B46_06565 [Opitutales bacterium]|nr:hypothetical protein [Opitutales bacterium]